MYVLFDTNRWMNNDKEWQIDVTTDRKRVGDLFRRKNPTCANILSRGEARDTGNPDKYLYARERPRIYRRINKNKNIVARLNFVVAIPAITHLSICAQVLCTSVES